MFSAISIDKGEAGQSVSLTSLDESDLPDGDVSIEHEDPLLPGRAGVSEAVEFVTPLIDVSLPSAR